MKPLSRYGDISIFQDGGRRHLGFLKFEILTVGRLKNAELRGHAKFRRNRSKRGGDIAIFQDGGRRHLGFFKFQFFNGRAAQKC